jgi:hypothetical protein
MTHQQECRETLAQTSIRNSIKNKRKLECRASAVSSKSRTVGGWLASLVLCLGVGFRLEGCGVVDSGLIVGAALATTALGTLMPATGYAARSRPVLC